MNFSYHLLKISAVTVIYCVFGFYTKFAVSSYRVKRLHEIKQVQSDFLCEILFVMHIMPDSNFLSFFSCSSANGATAARGMICLAKFGAQNLHNQLNLGQNVHCRINTPMRIKDVTIFIGKEPKTWVEYCRPRLWTQGQHKAGSNKTERLWGELNRRVPPVFGSGKGVLRKSPRELNCFGSGMVKTLSVNREMIPFVRYDLEVEAEWKAGKQYADHFYNYLRYPVLFLFLITTHNFKQDWCYIVCITHIEIIHTIYS